VGESRTVEQPLKQFRTLDRFRLPHSFHPALTLPEACVAVIGALARIFLGSLLFSVCGALAWHSWATIPEMWLRLTAVLLVALTFLASLAALMIGIKAAVDGMLTRVRA
jgi:hypothetical protein